MPGNPTLEFKAIELEADLLRTPFRIQTNWHIITGAPSCGKTTLINTFASNGFHIAPEGARLYMEREIASGRTIEELRSNVLTLQGCIKDMQLEIERELPAKDCIFLDRGIPDCLAWYRVFGLDPNTFLRYCFNYRYASVFLLDPLPLQQNGLRFKDAALHGFLEDWHVRDYHALGYRITRVPVMSPEERVHFILRVLTEEGKMHYEAE